MADWKYIMVQVGDRKLPIIFPDVLVHKDMMQRTQRLFYDLAGAAAVEDPETVSAGFISGLAVTGVHGQSESLDIKSIESDASIINCMPYENGRESVITGIERMILMKTAEMLMQRAMSPLGED